MFFSLFLMALAASPQAGEYTVTRDTIHTEKRVWSVYCDGRVPAPPSTKGRKLQVAVRGEEWTAQGAGRKFGTASCEGRNRTLAAVSRSVKSGRVTLSCKSERVTVGTEKSDQTVWVKDGTLRLKTVATLHFKDRGDDCVSVLRRETTLKPTSAPVAAEPADPCASPGPVANLALEPKILSVRAGKAPVCFTTTAVDKNGCTTRPAAISFVADPPNAVSIDDKGCVAASKIPKTRIVGIVATVGKIRGEAGARLISTAKKASRKTKATPKEELEELANETESDVARRVIREVTRGEITIQPLLGPPPQLSPLTGGNTGLVIAVILLLLGAFAIGLGLFLGRKRKRSAVAERVVTPQKGLGLVCPQCKFEFAAGEATVCPFDGTSLRRHHKTVRQTMYVPLSGGMACPTCFAKFPTKARFCGHDGSALVANYGQFDDEGVAE